MKKIYLLLLAVSMQALLFSMAQAQDTVKINFTGMNPHVGKPLYLRVVDVSSNTEVGRTMILVTNPAFTLAVGGIMPDSSYNLDFYADLNGNGRYDAPPADHAWRITLDSVKGDTTVQFAHNTSFTDIGWVNRITVAFSGMNPHVGENLYFALKYKNSKKEIERKSLMEVAPAFDVTFDNVMADSSYMIDFFADHSKNGRYDAPPTDHAWRIVLDSIKGDTVVPFVHNTSFTDIGWVNRITLAFSGMNPHIGENLYFALKYKNSQNEIERKSLMEETPAFNVTFDSVMADSSYMIDFFADHSKNGRYDAPPTDHAWRIILDSIKGDTVVPFVHNTQFTDIKWKNNIPNGITIAFSNMDPHVGENLYFALKYKSGWEIERRKLTEVSPSFDVTFDNVKVDSSYIIDFFADHLKNGRYDAPPEDHAWRIVLDSIKGDTLVPFVHNTQFTDIKWNNKLTINFSHMTPHLNQVMKLYLRNDVTSAFIDSVIVNPVMTDTFSLVLYSIVPDSSYNIDFWVDFNNNQMYDAPPVDHAWRIPLMDVRGDTVVNFEHNTQFTDIGLGGVPSGVDNLDASGFSTYPNPAIDELIIRSNKSDLKISSIRIFNASGMLVLQKSNLDAVPEVRINVTSLKPGMYILNVGEGQNSKRLKFIKE